MKIYIVTCQCGDKFGLTEMQYNDLKSGMLGHFQCKKNCGRTLFPLNILKMSYRPKIEEFDVNASDLGWMNSFDFKDYLK